MSVTIPVEFAAARAARYEDMLRTIEWRAFACRMKEMAGYACERCRRGGPGVELNVHHHAYEADRLPWEYERHEVAVLCGGPSGCHGLLHGCLKEFRRHVFAHLTPQSFRVLNGALTVGLTHNDPLQLCHAIANLVSSPGSIERFANDWSSEKEGNFKKGK